MRLKKENTTLFAKWTKAYTVKVNDGTDDGYYTTGSTVTIKSTTPPTGQRFKAWSVEGDSVKLENAANETTTFIMPTSEVVVNATYEAIPKPKTYTVTYNPNGETAETTGALYAQWTANS